jgi:hypothetical protein
MSHMVVRGEAHRDVPRWFDDLLFTLFLEIRRHLRRGRA